MARLKSSFRGFLSYLRLVFLSLTYNDHLSWSYVMDTTLEPLLWAADHFAKALGPIFVTCVILLNMFVVGVAYWIGLPFYWEKNWPLAVLLVVIGKLLLANVVFHYYMAFFTGPGEPPKSNPGSSTSPPIPEVTSICKKCIAPKPPRTHHCSVCDRCVLKMDHHCPWLNNCIGHRNHRHFFLYMTYTVLGCFFLIVFGFELVYEEITNPSDEGVEFSFMSRHCLVGMEAFLTTGTFLILGCLTLWHAKLISKGETSIEAHINHSETVRLKKIGKDYRNPYDFSPWHNWCLFLGVVGGRGWECVLFPSRHKPKGDGLTWDSVYNCDIEWNDRLMQNELLMSAAKIA